MKLSVIIPAYNAELNICKSIASIEQERLPQCEIIVVDDGSTDRTAAMIRTMAKHNPCIRMLSRTNGGPSAARNAALDVATGDCITFVDADDFIAPGTLQAMMRIMEAQPECDIVEYPVVVRYKGKEQHMLQLSGRSYADSTQYWLFERGYEHAYVWNKVYRSHLFATLRFAEGKLFEDALIMPALLKAARRIVTTQQGLYYYYDNASGITRNADGNAMQNLMEAQLSMLDDICSRYAETPQWAAYYMDMLNIQIVLYRLKGTLMLPKKPVPLRAIGHLRGRQRVKLLLYKLFGIKGICRILKSKG